MNFWYEILFESFLIWLRLREVIEINFLDLNLRLVFYSIVYNVVNIILYKML